MTSYGQHAHRAQAHKLRDFDGARRVGARVRVEQRRRRRRCEELPQHSVGDSSPLAPAGVHLPPRPVIDGRPPTWGAPSGAPQPRPPGGAFSFFEI